MYFQITCEEDDIKDHNLEIIFLNNSLLNFSRFILSILGSSTSASLVLIATTFWVPSYN